MTAPAPTQLWPDDKLSYAKPFSYAKAIIKEDVTYPIIPTIPVINVPFSIDIEDWWRWERIVSVSETIPLNTFFIAHVDIPAEYVYWQEGAYRETLFLKIIENNDAPLLWLGEWSNVVGK